MTGFNHAAIGGFIAKVLPLPLAIPVALASHFALDAMPHYGIPQNQRDGRFWRYFTTIDFMVAWGLLGGISLSRHHYAVFLCGLIAASPDFIWVARVIQTRSFNLSDNKTRFAKWHAKIQRYERPWGIYIELPLAIVLCYLVIRYW